MIELPDLPPTKHASYPGGNIMHGSRIVFLLAAATVTAGSAATVCWAQNMVNPGSPPSELHPPIKLDADTLRAKLTPSNLGLKPLSGAPGGVELPFGLTYSSAAKSVLIPLDQKNEWGVGIGLNMNSSTVVEMSPSSSLGLQPSKRTPGVMLQKKF